LTQRSRCCVGCARETCTRSCCRCDCELPRWKVRFPRSVSPHAAALSSQPAKFAHQPAGHHRSPKLERVTGFRRLVRIWLNRHRVQLGLAIRVTFGPPSSRSRSHSLRDCTCRCGPY
jgi:hypothetical protein